MYAIYNERFTTHAGHSLNPLSHDVFVFVLVFIRSLLFWSIKIHDVDISVFCLFLHLRFNSKRIIVRLISVFHSGAVNRKNSVPFDLGNFQNSHRNIWSNGKRPKTKSQWIALTLVSCYFGH